MEPERVEPERFVAFSGRAWRLDEMEDSQLEVVDDSPSDPIDPQDAHTPGASPEVPATNREIAAKLAKFQLMAASWVASEWFPAEWSHRVESYVTSLTETISLMELDMDETCESDTLQTMQQAFECQCACHVLNFKNGNQWQRWSQGRAWG